MRRRHASLISLIFACLGCASTDDRSIKDALVDSNIAISHKLDHWAKELDAYLANRPEAKGLNKSKLTIYNALTFAEDGERHYSPHIGAKVHLPKLQEKLQLAFTNYDEDRQNRGINENRYRTTPAEKTYTTSLSLLQDLGNVKTEFRPLLEFSDRLETSYLFRFFSDAERGDFLFSPELQLFARSDTGTGQFLSLEMGLKANDSNTVKLINEEQYTDGDNTLSTNQGVKWTHSYNKVMSHENALIFESDNRSIYHLTRTIYSSAFKHKLYVEMLHYSVTPYLTFARPQLLHPVAAIDFKLEIIF